MKISAIIGAYLTEHSQEELACALRRGDAEAVVNALTYSTSDMSDVWAPMGQAAITIDMPDETAVRHGLAEMLKKKRAAIAAEAQRELTKIDGQINSLLAIEHTPQARQSVGEASDGLPF